MAADLQVLVFPVPGTDLLLPGGSVAEVLRGEELGPPRAGEPDWVLGTLSWRGHAVPVAHLLPPAGPGAGLAAVAVCFAPGGDRALPYLAIWSPGLPRLERVTPESLASEPEVLAGIPWFVATALRLNGRAAWLLDLAALEQGLLGQLARPPSGGSSELGAAELG